MRFRIGRLLLAALAVLAAPAAPAAARSAPVTQANMLDRIQIEDMMVEYYTLMNEHIRHGMGDYFAENAALDLNGLRIEGRVAIQHLYENGVDTRIQPSSTYYMLNANPRIVVSGDKAVMDSIWTGYLSDNRYTAPRLVEQGTEHTTFVKENGVWLITGRTLVNKGGMPPSISGENVGN